MANCVDQVAEVIGQKRKLSKEEKEQLKKIAKEIDAHVEKMKSNTTTPEMNRKLLGELKEMLVEHKDNLQRYKLNHLNSVSKQTAARVKLDKVARGADGKFDYAKTEKELLRMIEGDGSVDSAQRVFKDTTNRTLKSVLTKNKVYDLAMSGELDDAVGIAMMNKANGFEANVTDKNVLGIMEALKVTNDAVHARTVGAGVHIGYVEGYMFAQGRYDLDKMVANKDLWVSKMMEGLDTDRVFSKVKAEEFKTNPEKYKEFLEKLHDDIVAPPILTVGDKATSKDYLSKLKSRKFLFKSGEIAWDIEKTFGFDGTLMHKVEQHIQSNTTFIGNAQTLGINPAQHMGRVLEYVRQNMDNKNDFNKLHNAVNAAFINVVAPPHSPISMLGKTANSMRALSAFTKLGSSVITASYDVVPTALQYTAKSGAPIIKSFGKAIAEFASVVKSQVKGEDMFTQIDDIMGLHLSNDPLIHMGLSTDKQKNFFGERGNKFLAAFSDLTGTPLQTKASKSTNARLHGELFEQLVSGKKNEYMINNIQKKYDLSDADLSVINKAKRTELDGRKIIAPEDIFKIEGVEPQYAQELFVKYATYINDMVHKGTPTPTAKTKRQLGMGLEKDDVTRNVFKMVMQFKETAWKLLTDNKDALMEIHSVGGKGRVATSAIELAAVSAMTFLAIEEARAIMFNRKSPLERWDDKEYQKVMADFITKAAFAPVLADMLETGYAGRPGQAAEYILGPNYATAKDFGNIIANAIDPDRRKNFGKSVKQFAKRHMSPSNWVPFKAAEGHVLGFDIATGRKFNK